MPGNINTISPSVILSWPTPNYVDPVERNWMPIFSGTFQALSTLMVCSRLWLRLRRQAGALGLDDAFLILGFLFGSAFSALSMVSTIDYGTNRHIWDVEIEDFPQAIMIAWVSELAFVLSTCCTKVSVLLFYRRLVEGSFSKKWKHATIAAIAFTVIYCLVVVLFIVFTCNPTDAYWKAYMFGYTNTYHCIDTKFLNPLSSALSVVSDFYAVVLPVAMMRHFETNRQKKIALNAVFSLGLVLVLAGIVRSYFLTQIGTGTDLTWIGFNVFVWSELECQLALIVASAPALRVLFRQYIGQPLSRAYRSRSQGDTFGSNNRSTNRNSVPLESPTFPRPKGGDDVNHFNDKQLLGNGHTVKPSVATDVEAQTVDSRNSSFSANPDHSPVAYHSYAMQNLELRGPS